MEVPGDLAAGRFDRAAELNVMTVLNGVTLPGVTKSVFTSEEQQFLLNALIRNAPVAVAIIDIHGVFENVNAPCCKIYGYERAELIGSNFSGLFPLHERKRVLELNRQFIQEGGELKGDWSVVRKDGRTIGVRIESVRVPGVKNAARRLVYVSELLAAVLLQRPALLEQAES